MKKNPIIFIAMLIALAFTSCQMNTDDSVVTPPAPTYTIKVNATNGTASYPKTAKAGEKVTITATADSGYVLDNATNAFAIPDTKVSDDKTIVTFTFEMPEKDVTINVTFKTATPAPTTEATYKITVTATNGTVTLSKTEAKAGEKVFVESIEAANGYTAEGLEQTFQSKDGKTLTLDFGTEDGKRYFVMPECNVVITVTFKAATPAPTTEATSYKVVYGDQTIGTGLTITDVNNCISQFGLVETTDYSINDTTGIITLTASGYETVKPYLDNGKLPTTPTTDGGEDNGIDEPPVTTNKYTVSVASGIKGGHIEVSLDNVTWTTLSTSTKYAKNTKLYVRAVADKHYEYKDGLRTDGLEGQLKYIVLNSNAELNANFVIKNESLTPGSLAFNDTKSNLSNYRRLVRIDIGKSGFSESYKDARLAFGFSDGFYGINKRIGSTSTDKYFYVYDTVIPYDTFKLRNDQLYSIFVAINLDNGYELPDGEIYVLFPNLKNSDGKSVMYVAKKNKSTGTFEVNIAGASTTTSDSAKYYFDASQL